MRCRIIESSLLAIAILVGTWYLPAAEGAVRAAIDVEENDSPMYSGKQSGYQTPARPFRGPAPSFPEHARIWGMQRSPVLGPPRIFGRTTSGCIAGAVPLSAQGDGFIRRRPWRPTNYGHPSLVDYIEHLGERARRSGLGPILVGDLSLPRGGAFMHGHFSHQTGLDVDIAYKTFISRSSRVPPTGPMSRPPKELRRMERILRLAAADPRVDRIFVGAGIKALLCRTVTDKSFLDLLRPWWGHEKHFHVRLRCPADSPECRPNPLATEIPDDCRSLATWWRSPRVQPALSRWRASDRASYDQALPKTCQTLPDPVGIRTAAIRVNRRTNPISTPPKARMGAASPLRR